MWKRWSKSSTSLAAENMTSHTHLERTVTTPESKATATRGQQDSDQTVAKGKEQGTHQIKTHHNENDKLTFIDQHRSPWQALGGLAPRASAALQGELIPGDKNLTHISVPYSEAAQFDIPSTDISASITIMSSSDTGMLSVPTTTNGQTDASKKPRNRLSINFFSGKSGESSNDKAKLEKKSASQPKFTRADREAFAYAITVRDLSSPNKSNDARRANLKKVKEKLLDPTSAAAIVHYLRRLPPPGDSATLTIEAVAPMESRPTQVVSLSMTDEEADKLFSSRLRTSSKSRIAVNGEDAAPVSLHNASLSSIVDVFKDLQLVSYLGTEGNLGLGDSVDDQPSAILSGSFPSSQTFMTGLTDIAKALLDLGYASDELPYPDHKNVHPPTDRMSIITYMWGFEVCIPHPSVAYLGKVDSVCQTVSRLLSAISIVNVNVREIAPFVHYVASAIDFEWKAVKAQDKGQGVICTGTWIMPVAVFPRPWDFSPAPPNSLKPGGGLSDMALTSTTAPPASNDPSSNGPSTSQDPPTSNDPSSNAPSTSLSTSNDPASNDLSTTSASAKGKETAV